ncbi:aminoglycoside phosphotransferase family protein [Candidatus Kaiserbacteria bacterium]|nr:aminoglycoside phosphotransferase family protein [Candidatus Kaiserbacteria bacterium]
MPNLTVEGTDFTLVTKQRSGQRVYRGKDSYLRIGDAAAVSRELTTHQKMEALGFPVASILSVGSFGTESYFIEQSLGEKRFRDLFESDFSTLGSVSDAHFSDFLCVSERYLTAQSKALVTPDPENFAKGIHLDILREELPQYITSLRDKFERVLQKISGFPYVLTHGDFNPSNMYPLGVIDFEDSFSAPFGFDAICALSTVEWFPDPGDFEYVAKYRFTPSQKLEYLAMCDAVCARAGFPAVSQYYGDFAFCRAVWSTVRMQAWPKLQTWRYERFIKTFLFS